VNLVAAHFIAKLKPVLNEALPSQDMYKSMAQLKLILGAGVREIKRFVREKEIRSYNGYYKIWDFDEFVSEGR